MEHILLKNVTSGAAQADILVSDGLIRRIAPSGTLSADWAETDGDRPSSPARARVEVVDCTGKAVIPGFVNMHTHAGMALMRGIEEDVLFHKWLDRIWKVESHLDAEYVSLATKIACLEMIKTGTTTYNDQYWFPSDAFRASSQMGLRHVQSYVFLDKFDAEEARRQKDECLAVYEDLMSHGGQGLFTVGIHAIYSVSEPTMLWAAEFARKKGLRIHIHLSETKKEVDDCLAERGISPVEYLDRLGLLGPDVIAAHTLWLSDKDVELLGRRKVNCVHNINSNLKLASGYRFRYNELRDAGANVCIGTDGCASSNNLDILEALKTAAIVQKAWREDPSAMPLDELLDVATVNGARALGLNTGRIEEGRAADMLLVDMDNTFFLSQGPFLANLVYSAHSDCIDSVICGGKFLMRGRKVEGEKELLAQARAMLSSRGSL